MSPILHSRAAHGAYLLSLQTPITQAVILFVCLFGFATPTARQTRATAETQAAAVKTPDP